jgi:hypothetical protein
MVPPYTLESNENDRSTKVASPKQTIPANAKRLRCSIHSYDFPPRPEYLTCPECGEPTSAFSHGEPMPDDEAHSILAHARFSEYLEKVERL